MNPEDNWDQFKHKVVEQPTAEAGISKDGEVWVRVVLKAKHWLGNENVAQPCTHAMGFIVPIKGMWTIAEGCETPFKHCEGRDCGKQSKEEIEIIRKARYVVENNRGLDQEEMNMLWRALDIAEK